MIENIEECVKKVKTKKINEHEWLILDKECPDCLYCGIVKIYYCRNRKIYFAQQQNDK